MTYHILLFLVGITGIAGNTYYLVELEKRKKELKNPLYVRTRRRELLLWILIFLSILLDHGAELYERFFV